MNKLLFSFLLVVALAACTVAPPPAPLRRADLVGPAGLTGPWFEWRAFNPQRPFGALESDGSGIWGGTPVTWSYDANAKVVTIRAGTVTQRWRYDEGRKALGYDDGGANADRVQRGEMPYSLPVMIKADSPMRF